MMPMMSIDRLVAESIEEEMARAPGLAPAESDWPALFHAIGQAWRDTPQVTKDFLIAEAMRLVKQLGQDPKGAVAEIARYAAFLVLGQRLSPTLAVRTATKQVIGRRQRGAQPIIQRPGVSRGAAMPKRPKVPPGSRRRSLPPRPLSKTRWQRGRRGDRFEDWV